VKPFAQFIPIREVTGAYPLGALAQTSRARAAKSCRAFSLLEIMVAVTSLAIIMVGLLAMFYQTQRAFRSGATQSDVLEGGRTTMELITRDLQELYPTRVSHVTNFAAVDISPSLVQPLPSGDGRTNVLQEAIFMTRVNDRWVGNVLLVADSDLGVGTLLRLTASSADVVGLNNYLAKAAPSDFHRVTDGVIHFRFDAYNDRGELITDPRVQLPDGAVSLPRNGWADGYVFTNNFLPAFIDVELGILEPKTLTNFRAKTNYPAAASAYLQRQAGRVHLFKQRVHIRADPTLHGS
jgi:hypothetical protein